MQGAHDFTAEVYRYCSTEITVETRGAGRWVVSNGSSVWNRDGQWEYEPLPSSRDDEFLRRTRYANLEDAFVAAREAWRSFVETPVHPAAS